MKTIKRNCKHHGLTPFYLFNDGSSRCQECAKTLRKERYKRDPSYDNNYARQWMTENPKKILEYQKKYEKEKSLARKKAFNQFFSDNLKFIESICGKLGLNLSKKEIKTLFPIVRSYSRKDIANRLIIRKRREMLQEEVWRQSTRVKFDLGVRDNYKSLSEGEKEIVRTKYKKEARKIVNEKLKKIISTL